MHATQSSPQHRRSDVALFLTRFSYLFAVIALCAAQAVAGGTLDPTFGNNGEADIQGEAFALQPDGKIVMVSKAGSLGSYGFAVRRFHSNGSPDVYFGGKSGVVTIVTPSSDYPTSLAIQPDGKIVVAQRSPRTLNLKRAPRCLTGKAQSFLMGGLSMPQSSPRSTRTILMLGC